MQEKHFLSELISRGLYDNSNAKDEIDHITQSKDKKFIPYIGFDLTADGLHVGHLSALMCIKLAIKSGHHCIIILGGGTTYIGDPSGKNETRKILTPEQISHNKKGICTDILRILAPKMLSNSSTINSNIKLDRELVFQNENITIVDNFYWLNNLNYIDFLRDVGSHFSVNKLIKMDSMRTRLEKEDNLSFIEFNYPLLQSYDFYFLNKKYDCNCQIGGSDQWGNILRGIELISKLNKNNTFGITIPLTLRSDGKKMGKSEDGAVWLNPEKLNDKSYWQYFRNTNDGDIEKFFLIFTELSTDEIENNKKMDINIRKEILATEATKLCRGEKVANNVRQQMLDLFSNKVSEDDIIDIESGNYITEILLKLELFNSKNEVKKLIKDKGLKINGVTIEDEKLILDQDFTNQLSDKMTDEFNDLPERVVIISIGKRNRIGVRISK